MRAQFTERSERKLYARIYTGEFAKLSKRILAKLMSREELERRSSSPKRIKKRSWLDEALF